ncbi:hypothetical protein Tco_1335449 [Tanacetum coccineum]
MPYPRFTKANIHYFMCQHKSIYKRQGLPYHTVDNDNVLDRLKFISKGDIYQVYGKAIPDSLKIDDIQNSEAYNTFIGVVIPKKATAASKKKRPKKKVSIRDESTDEELEEEEERLIRRNPRGVVTQDTPPVLKKKSTDPSQKLKLKGIGLLFNAAQLEIDTQKAIKANKHESGFQHQSGGSSEGSSLGSKVPDDPRGKFIVLHEGVDIPWVSTDDDESENDNEEDDASIDIKKTDERTNTNVEDQVKGVAEMNIAEEAEEENTERVEEQKDDEELKADEEKKEMIKLEMNN